jgi:hypothetical protein
LPFSYCPCYQHETLISAPMALARWTISIEGWWQRQYEKDHVSIYSSHILPGQITYYCPSQEGRKHVIALAKCIAPERQITRRKLCFYYTCKFGVISIKYVIKHNIIYSYKYLEFDLIKHCHVIFVGSTDNRKVHHSRGKPKEIPTWPSRVSNYSYFPGFNRQQPWCPATGSSL